MIWIRAIAVVVIGAVGVFLLLPSLLSGSLFASPQTDAVVTPLQLSGARLPEIPDRPPEPQRIAQGEEPEVSAASVIVVDVETGKVLYEKNPDEVRSIASLTKLVTLPVALSHNPDWDASHAMTAEENELNGAKLQVQNGEEVRVDDIFYTTLIGSANNTALALATIYGGKEAFVAEMNAYVKNLGLTQSSFVEPTGLSANNVSTAREMATVASVAFAHPEIGPKSTQSTHDLVTLTTNWAHTVKSTNLLLESSKYKLLGGKTGYTVEAGWCLISEAEIQGHPVVVVVLGTPEDNARFSETETLLDYLNGQFAWPARAN